jgi:hypothetical protein
MSLVFLLLTLGLTAVPSHVWSQTAVRPPDDGKREFTISGCLLRNGYAAYLVDEAGVTAIDGKPQPNPTAGAPVPARLAPPKRWMLEGGGNLGPRVGEKVEIVGRSDWQPPSSEERATDELPARPPRLDVTSVKTLASSCA